jgi:hypothetical protein
MIIFQGWASCIRVPDARAQRSTSWTALPIRAARSKAPSATDSGTVGESERVLGRWLASRAAGGNVVVATKVGAHTLEPGDPSQAGDGRPAAAATRA